eukprot:TRINITY_DN7535_c0_g1_i1.p1 TRINITY_DN7535_c0_g1~~TRINITY_DN7535_c0_g1_i1.p1  ORF type:complete len:208 (-),score=30.16 TRINITY_DN7535_c0_g1_i1:301-924(-)
MLSPFTITSLQEFLDTNPNVSLGQNKYSSPSGGICKQLNVGELGRLSVVIQGTVVRIDREHRGKVIIVVDEETSNTLQKLVNLVSSDLNSQNVKDLSWSYEKTFNKETTLEHFTKGKLISARDGRMFTKVYDSEGVEIELHNWPNKFKGYIELSFEGIYIADPKSRDSSLTITSSVQEMLIESNMSEVDKGSKIQSMLKDVDTSDLW